MKVFDGNKFLASRECSINFSNGSTYVVKDLSDTALTAMSKIDETTAMTDIRKIVGQALATDVAELKDIGIVELQGALAFLSESLFAQK